MTQIIYGRAGFTHDLLSRHFKNPKATSVKDLVEPEAAEPTSHIEPPLCPNCSDLMELTCYFKHSRWFECCELTMRVIVEPRTQEIFGIENTPDWYEKAKVQQRVRRTQSIVRKA